MKLLEKLRARLRRVLGRAEDEKGNPLDGPGYLLDNKHGALFLVQCETMIRSGDSESERRVRVAQPLECDVLTLVSEPVSNPPDDLVEWSVISFELALSESIAEKRSHREDDIEVPVEGPIRSRDVGLNEVRIKRQLGGKFGPCLKRAPLQVDSDEARTGLKGSSEAPDQPVLATEVEDRAVVDLREPLGYSSKQRPVQPPRKSELEVNAEAQRRAASAPLAVVGEAVKNIREVRRLRSVAIVEPVPERSAINGGGGVDGSQVSVN